MKKEKHIHNKRKNYLFDSGIGICWMTKTQVEKELKNGFIKLVKGYSNVFQTDMRFLTPKEKTNQ